jgi:hypothetical protein
MSLKLIFWILMLIWAVFGFVGTRLGPWAPYGSTLLLFILLLILGWGVFGAPVQG